LRYTFNIPISILSPSKIPALLPNPQENKKRGKKGYVFEFPFELEVEHLRAA
jgi:hypothetical protein